ncbi:MAG: 3-deoxy-manno-octulosonate cytidylyltransferase [Deltaproteobacteria bacterium]|nr:3-deoxy-manno-octulosonate cytidylyltransferase [Deltaproteobacteria bacterium]MBW2448152.1 3-deoxy-manno-octulosonate cytidylyltransferase [Deltaproteobacteria bacterium]
MTAVGLIPARYAASRFPGKPLTPIAGKPMIQHVYEGARRAKRLQDVVIATDDERIAEACSAFDAPVVLTSPDHPTGTDRLAEAAAGLDAEIIVNIQGDEPLIRGFVIDAAVDALLAEPDAAMSTVVHAAEPEALDDPNRVKVVLDRRGRALWFSRAAIPALRNADAPPTWWQHVGLYVYRRSFLLDFVNLPQTPAELAEGLEQLRALEHGFAIQAAIVEGWRSVSVDVPEDVARVEALLAEAGR